MFDLNFKGHGYVNAETLKAIVEKMGEMIAEELHARDAEIRKLRADLDTERRLRLAMKNR